MLCETPLRSNIRDIETNGPLKISLQTPLHYLAITNNTKCLVRRKIVAMQMPTDGKTKEKPIMI